MIYSQISTALETIYCIYIFKHLASAKKSIYVIDILLLLANTFIIGSINNESIFPFLIGYAFYLIYAFITYPKEKARGVLMVNYLFLFVTIVQGVCALILSFFPLSSSAYYFPLIANAVTFVLVILAIKFLPLKALYTKITNSGIQYQIVFFNIYIMQVVLFVYLKASPKDLYGKTTTTIIIFLIILFLNLWLLYYDQKIKEQQMDFARYKQNQEIYNSLLHDIRASQHEYSNHIQSLQFLTSSCKTYDELVAALNKYTQKDAKSHRAYPLLKINMPILAATLYNQYKYAATKDIIVRFDITSEILECSVNELILADCCSILLQNAIEASKPDDIVYVNLGIKNGKFHFETRNKVDKYITVAESDKFFTRNYSTKNRPFTATTKRGYGLYTLKNIIQKNDGIVCTKCQEFNNNFHFIIFIEL